MIDNRSTKIFKMVEKNLYIYMIISIL